MLKQIIRRNKISRTRVNWNYLFSRTGHFDLRTLSNVSMKKIQLRMNQLSKKAAAYMDIWRLIELVEVSISLPEKVLPWIMSMVNVFKSLCSGLNGEHKLVFICSTRCPAPFIWRFQHHSSHPTSFFWGYFKRKRKSFGWILYLRW